MSNYKELTGPITTLAPDGWLRAGRYKSGKSSDYLDIRSCSLSSSLYQLSYPGREWIVEWSVICSKFPTIILFITLQALFTAVCHASDRVTGCDTCYAASGDNVTSCGQVSGLYTRPQLPPGLTIVTRIPRGSCDVSVTLLRPGANHLGQCQSRANIGASVQKTTGFSEQSWNFLLQKFIFATHRINSSNGI